MKVLANREGMLAAFGMVASVAPSRSPKPVLQSIKLIAHPDGSTLMATDLELGVTATVLGLKVDEPGSVLLPVAKVQSILRTSADEELAIEVDGDTITIRGMHAEFHLPTEDADLFPAVPEFDAESYHVIAAADLKRLIRRTIFATDCESTRYALGGVLFELTADSLSLVGTDGRRLAKATCAVEVEGEPKAEGSLVVPVKALKLIERNLENDDPPVHVAFQGTNSATFRMDRATIYTRLVEGRFPRYQDVFPGRHEASIPMEVGALLAAVEQASIMVSEESRGTDFTYGGGMLRLSSQASDVGKSRVESPVSFEGADIGITFDCRYLTDALKTLDPSSTIHVELIDHKNAAVFVTDDSYKYVVMPLTRDR